MASINPTTIFSKIPLINSAEDTEKDSENMKISHWLEKLHVQGDQLKKDNDIRDAKSKTDSEGQLSFSQQLTKKIQDFSQTGINEQTKNLAIKKEADMHTVNDLVKKSNRNIISISSQFPWDLFPNTIDVEESRVTFNFSQLFSSQSHSVDIKDISNVFIENSMLFASLQVVSRTFIQNDIKIEKLNKTKAKKVQKIIEGLRTFAEHDINTSNYEIEELVSKIEEFHTS